jgi:D-tyrosyl-tRNA(Tyr) deacylase
MRAVLTRVECASVKVNGETVSEIGKGFLVLLGIHAEDTQADAVKIADKICNLRVFSDDNGKMNISPKDAAAELLIISQFTLYGDCRSRRPGFTEAARPETAIPLYELCISECRNRGFKVSTGEFGADMKVYSVNDGPVTLILDTKTL